MSDETLHPASAELEAQLRRLETIADPATRGIATDLLAAVLQFHTAALQRMLELVESAEGGAKILAALDRDPLVRSVLLVHDLHPESLASRVRRVVAELEPMAHKRGAQLELLEAGEDLIRVRVRGAQGLASSVEHAIRNAAPEAAQVIVEEPAPVAGFVSLETLQNSPTANRQSEIGNRQF